jgi:hypothetical protein
MKLYLNDISVITNRTKACVRMRVREKAVMVLSPQVLVPEISISLYYSMTANFQRRVLHAYL